MDAKGIPYSSDLITDKENTLLFIWNHESGPDTQMDKCKKKPKFGYTWDGAVPPVILEFHNKKINSLEIKIFRLSKKNQNWTKVGLMEDISLLSLSFSI